MGETSTQDVQDSFGGWAKFAQNMGSTVIGAWASATYQQPFEIEKLKIQALGDTGYYTEGETTTGGTQRAAGVSPILLLGGLVALVLLLNKA